MSLTHREVLKDDIDGTDATHTILFCLGNISYEIDLSAENARIFHEQMSFWEARARVTTARRGPGNRRAGGHHDLSSQNAALVRQWAVAHGYEVSRRGRLPQAIYDAYRACYKPRKE